jgi:hypothetical protein
MSVFRRVPWIAALIVAKILFNHYRRLDQADRNRALDHLRTPPHKMTNKQREDLKNLAKSVDAWALSRDLASVVMPIPKSKKPKK